MTGKEALAEATETLRFAGIPDPLRDARRLLAFYLNSSGAGLTALQDERIPPKPLCEFQKAIAARSKFQPVAQIIGQREFWGRDFKVTSDTLDPRPDTELLVELALRITPVPNTILDLGTGTGCIAISILAEHHNAQGVATDISNAALKVAHENAASHQVSNRLSLKKSDWFTNVNGKFDVIISNPPYIAEAEADDLAPDVRDWEPESALFAGPDGLADYKKIAQGLPHYLSQNGTALFEIGATQSQDVCGIFTTSQLIASEVVKDINNKDRVVVVNLR